MNKTVETPKTPDLKREKILYRAALAGALPYNARFDFDELRWTLADEKLARMPAAEAVRELAALLPRPVPPGPQDPEARARFLAARLREIARKKGLVFDDFYSDGERHIYQNGRALLRWRPRDPLPPGTYPLEALSAGSNPEELRKDDLPKNLVTALLDEELEGPYAKDLARARINERVEMVGAVLEGDWLAEIRYLEVLKEISALQIERKRSWVFAQDRGLLFVAVAVRPV